jgi:hypothetical protein
VGTGKMQEMTNDANDALLAMEEAFKTLVARTADSLEKVGVLFTELENDLVDLYCGESDSVF